jgi:ligand-binding SRPBCC domain-containing protein
MASPFEVVERTSTLTVPPDEAFAWHERPGAFERITPPWERITVLERTDGIQEGARTAVRLQLGPVRLRWVAEHREYAKGRRFVDQQTEGPFSHWVHEHRFESAEGGRTRYTDRIEFGLTFGVVGSAARRMARARAERMLAYRHATVREDLAAHARHRARPRLRVAVTGATGLLGSALIPFLTTGGHQAIPVSRRRRLPGAIHWASTRWCTWRARRSARAGRSIESSVSGRAGSWARCS